MRYLTHQQLGKMLWLYPPKNRQAIGNLTNPQRLLTLYKQIVRKENIMLIHYTR